MSTWKKRMRRRIATGMIWLWAVNFIISLPVLAEQETIPSGELYARSAVLMDGETGRILYEKEGEMPLANASTTKILTCILILENCDLDEVAEASSKATGQPRVRLGMRVGQKFYVRDLLYALMLESFNDCAVVLAEHAAGSVEAFTDQMNQKAIEIGCKDSHFVTPNGLDGTDEDGNHHTTAVDLSKMMQYCIMKSPEKERFLHITQTASYTFQEVSGGGSYTCYNHNTLLTMMTEAISGKTGFTNQAGYCYVGAAEEDDRTLIVSLLGCGWPPQKNYKWLDAMKLLKYGFTHFEEKKISDQIKELPLINLVGCREKKIPVQMEGNLSAMVSEEERLVLIYRVPGVYSGQVMEGDRLGSVDYYADGDCLGSLPLYAMMESHVLTYEDFLKDLLYCFLGWKEN